MDQIKKTVIGEYWLKKLSGQLPEISLPSIHDVKKPNTAKSPARYFQANVPSELTVKLKKIAKNNDIGLFILLLSALNLGLHKYTGTGDLIVGILPPPVNGKNGENGKDGKDGKDGNILFCRTQVAPNLTVKEVIDQTKEEVTGAVKYSQFSLVNILAQLEIKNNNNSLEIFRVALVWETLKRETRLLDRFDLAIALSDSNTQIALTVKYQPHPGAGEMVERFSMNIIHLLAGIIDNPVQPVAQLDAVNDEEKHWLLYVFNDPAVDYPRNKTIHELFAEQAGRVGDKIAVVDMSQGALSYKELNGKSNGLARLLIENGVKPDTIVGIMIGRSLEMIIGIIGILKSGGAYLPIDPEYPQERIDYMLKDSGAGILVKKSEIRISKYETNSNDTNPFVLDFEHLNFEFVSDFGFRNSNLSPANIAYIIYTSGTTGRPKGVLIENRNVVRLLFNDRFQFDFNDQDVWSLFHSYSFDFSVWEMYGALLYGGRLVIIKRGTTLDPGEFLKVLKQQQVTILNQTPSAFYNLMYEELKQRGKELKARYIIFGGEALQPGKLNEWQKKYPAVLLVNMFGITETTVHVTYQEIGAAEIEAGISNIGKPIPTLGTYIMDENRLLPMGAPGELCVGGEGVARGYLNRPELTAEKFNRSNLPDKSTRTNTTQILYRSGDRVRLTPGGQMEYLGRIDHQVQIRGFRVELGEIESLLLKHEHIRDAVVIDRKEEEDDHYLCAYIVPHSFQSETFLDTPSLQNYLSRQLPGYMIPPYFVLLAEIPLTGNGKVDRKRLPLPQVNLEETYIAPRNNEERILTEIWQDVLSLKRVGINDNFFNVGGDSIKAIQLSSAINNRLNSHIKILDLYTHGTIGQLATLLDRQEAFDRQYLYSKVTTEIAALKARIFKQKPELADIVEDIYPMSDIEKGMVFYYWKHMSTGIYHDQFVYPVYYQHFKAGLFEQAINLMMRKHPILRTGFNLDDFEESVSIIYKEVIPNYTYRDMTELSSEEQQRCLAAFLAADRQNPFDASTAPLWRVGIFESGKGNLIFTLVCHHAILDGWSMASLVTEIHNTYQELKNDFSYSPPGLKSTYKDMLIEELIEKQDPLGREYWRSELEEYPRLEFSETLKSKHEMEGMISYSYDAGVELLAQLNLIAERCHTSLKNLFFSAYACFMNMFSYEDDVVVGCVTNMRPEKEDGDKVLGCFLNTVPVRLKIPRGITWRQYIEWIEQKMLEVKKHERLSLFEIAAAVGEKNKDRNPIFDSLFNFMDFHIFRAAKPLEENKNQEDPSIIKKEANPQTDTKKTLFIENHQDTNTLFDFEVNITRGTVMLCPKYNRSAISDETVQRCCGYFLNILQKYIEEPDGAVRNGAILSNEEKEQLLYHFNDTAAPYSSEKTIHQLFEEQVSRTPERIAVIDRDGVLAWTYVKLNKHANRLARLLRKRGLKPGGLTAVIMDRSVHIVTAVMGILKAGGAYVPLEPYLPDERIRKILGSLHIETVISNETQMSKIGRISQTLASLTHIICLDKRSSMETALFAGQEITGPETIEHESIKNLTPAARSGDVAYVIFTSGSTGTPKGVVETHRPVINVLEWVNMTFGVGYPDKLLFVASLSFDLSVYDIFGILASGACLRVVAPGDIKNPETLLNIIMNEGITFWDSAPAALQQLVPFLHQVADYPVQSRLRLIFLSGDWIPVTMPDALREAFAGVQVISLGGATEATVWSNYYPIRDVDPLWPSIPYGKPIRNAKYYILDRNLELCPLRVPGDLYIGGECLAKEYMNDELLSAYKFIANPLATGEKIYRTGDVARWFEDGNMQFLGRKDQQVKIRGYRIELGEIESQLMDHPLVSGAIVLDRVDGSGNKYLCAYYVGKDKTKEEIDREELKEYLSRELPDYMLPAHFIRIEKIPLTANGKLDRRALPEPEINNENNYHYVPPENETQKKLVAIWSQVLGVDKESIGITADFFELGGHSLNATMVISRIHKEFNIKIPLAEIFNSSTIRELSRKINTPRGGEMYASVEPVEKKEYYLLSSAQKRLYFLQQMEPGNTVYNIQEAVLLEGDVDISLLAETFRQLIQRHESLRTSFEIVNNETVQRICPLGEFNIEHCEEGNSTIWRIFVRAFDLSEAPLLRVGIFRLAEKKYLLLTDMHHIISDGVSQAILKGDFEVLYSGGKLPGIRLQYKDYSEFQHSERQRQSLEKQEIFWLKELSGEIPVLDIPTDYTRPIIQSYEGNILTFDLEHDQAELLNKLGRDEKATLYMVLMAIYNVLLFKLGSGEEIIIGTPTAGRRHADLERIIGMFVNTLALKNYPTGEKTFPGFLQEVKENTIKAFENQDYPFEELVEQLLVKRDASRNPLFDVMFVLQNMEVETQKISGGAGNTVDNRGGSSVKMRPYPFTTAISRFDMTLTAVESRNGIHFTLEYCTRLFKEETVQRMIGYFKKIVSAVTIAGMSSLRLAEIEILSEAEKIRLLNEFNDTAADYPRNKNIHQLFEEQVARNGDKIAIIDMGQQALTYLELNEQSNGLARLLMAKGIKADTIAGIMMDHSLEMMIVIFGILKSGGAYLPIDPEYPPERIDYMLKDSGAKLLVTTNDKQGEKAGKWARKWAGKWEGEKVLLEDISQSLENPFYSLTFPPSYSLNSANLAYVIYTSGTTGKPKGVMVEHRQAINTLLCRREQYHLDRNVIALQLFSFTFDGFVTGFFTPLTAGARVIILPQEKIKNINIIRKAILKHGVTHFISVPALYGTILASAAPGDLKSLKAVTLAGDSVSTGYVEQTALEHKHIEIVVEYGVTEVTVMSTLGHHQECNPEITIGKPTANTVIYILGKNGEFRPIGCRGELYIGGHGVSRGYLNNPELTAEKFKRDFIRHSPFAIRSSKNFPNDPCPMTNGRLYQTGDVGRWLPDGRIEFLGRIDQQVKIRGFRIELAEIEKCLTKHEDIKEALVTVIKNSSSNEDKLLCAYFTGSRKFDVSELREYLGRELAGYMIPAYFEQLETIPLTINGKVDRRALPEPSLTAVKNYIAPGDSIEEKIAEIWSNVLGVKKETIGVQDDFFHRGGHSLKAMLLVSQLAKTLNVEFPLITIFKGPTVREMANTVKKSRKINYEGIKPVEKKEYYPLASAQRRLFFLEQLEDIGVTYNIPSVLKIEGKLDIKQLEQAVNKLLQRHETLRTSFRLIKNEPVQIVHENVNFKIEHYHCSDSPLPVIKDFIRPFDLSCAPLLHVGIVFLSTGEYLLLYDFHHIISDGTSIGILTDDFQALYDGRELPPLKHQYKDFSAWQNNLFETGKIEKQVHYWLECLSGQIPVLNLPTDYPRPGSLNFEGKTIGARLEEENASALKRFCLESGTTLYMNLLAVLNVVLYKYTHQSDIVVGAAVMGRPHSDLRRLIGMFVNSLAMRNFPDGEKKYALFLEEVKETCLNAFENQDVQFEWLVDHLKIKRDPSRNPLFDILLVVQNYEQATTFAGQDKNIPGELKFSAYPVENTTSKFDFNFSIWENGNTITFSLEYASKMYASSTARKILSNYLNILEQLIKNQDPGLLLMDVDILSEGEKKQLLIEFNDTVTPWPKDKTVYGLFGEIVSKNPDYPALIDPLAGTVTYGELNQRVNRLANYLSMEKNVRVDNRVGLLMDKSIDCIVALLGIQAAGGGYVPINPGLPEERIVEIIEDADIEVLISEKKYIKILNRLQWECRGLHTFLCMDSPDVYKEAEEQSGLMDKKLWEYVGESAEDDITGGGWKSSYTGLPISKEEMAEYSHNALEKVRPLLHRNARVLEIGCATGLTMYLVAPQVGLYYGTDLSSVIIARNMARIKVQGHSNIRLECLPAHEIDKIAEKDFDLIILNSVVQHFSGYNYLREIIKKAIELLGPRGVIFIGDVMDMDRKAALIKDLTDFKKAHQRSGYRTKTDWSEELFISQSFFHDLSADIPVIRDVAFSKKIGVIENELTKFRYDVLVTVDKSVESSFTGKLNVNEKHKYQDDRRALARQSKQTCLSRIEPHHLLYIIYTSGTTGKPKGVMIEHRNVVRLMSNDRFSFDFTNRDVWTMFHAYNFDFSVWEMYGALLFGGKLIIIPQMTARDTAEYLNILLREGVTILNQTPSAFYRLMDEDSNRLGGGLRLRYVIFGGEALNPGKLKNFNKKYPHVNLVNMYGITETTVHVTYKKITPVEIETGASNIGTPIPTLRVYIMDRDFNVIPVGAAGELYIGGDGVARGYLNRAELTSVRFINPTPIKRFRKSRNPFSKGFLVAEGTLYKSGDLGRYLANGDIEYLGRIDQQVKIRGFRLELGEIESHLRNHGEVKEAVVLSRDDGYGERYLCAYTVDEGKLDAQVLKEYLKKKLPDYMIPTYFVSLAKIPLTVNGKLDVRALPEPAAIEAGNNYIAPHDLIELKLVEIWSEVLKINRSAIGIDDDFFALGGHSLRATSVVSDIHKELNIKVPLAEIFKTPTIRELAKYIKDKNEDKFISIPPAEKKEYYALSPAQNRLYILQRMKEDSIGYNEYAVLELIGKVDKDKLEETFKKLITRHESFRTYFVKVGDYIVQRIAREVDFGVDYAEMPGERLEGIIAQFIRPFDLEKAPLLRVKLVRLGRERYWLIYDIHHIITDGTSMAVLMKEFAVLYTGKLLGPLGIQYKDFSQWQNSPAGKEMLKGQESYWLEEFNGEIPVLELNTDYPRPEFQEFAGERIHFVLGKDETRALKVCASNHEVTLFMLLLGVYNVLFSRLSGQEDVVVGTPIAARRHADLQRIIGMFVNTLALRNYPVGNKRFSDFLTEIKINTLKAFENQEYPFEELVEKVRVQRSLGRNPLFDIIFAVQNMESHAHDIPEAQIEGIELKWPEFPRKISKFDFSMHVMNETGENLLFTLEYSTSLFKKETVERFYGYFIQVALAIAAGPLKKIHEFEIISNQEKEYILYHFNATASEYPREKTVHRLFEAQVSRTPDRIVIIGPVGHVGPVSLSYRELHTRSDCLAGLLSEKGVLAESIVAIKMACSLEMIMAILAILKAGAAYLPIDPNYPQERIDYMLNDSGAQIILTAAECVYNFHHSPFIIHHSSPLAYIIYTSGTTGRPKGVMIEHHSLVNLCYWHNRYYKVNESDRALKYAGIGFDASVWEIFPYLLTGASLCIIDEEIKLDINELNRYFERYNITIGFLPTQVCEQFLELENRSLRKLLTGGDKLRHFKKKRYDVYNNYGPTENTVVSTSYWVEENCHNIPIGKPMANTGIYILDPGKMNLQPIGVPGELCVGGDSLSRGYLNNPELTAEKFVINSLVNFTPKKLYKTGDRARWSEDGNIEFLGRIDFQVKVRGNRIELAEIETLLLKHEKIKDVVVTAVAGPNGDTYLCTYAVSETGMAVSGLREYLEEYLPGYMIPSYFVWLDHIPLTSNGKVDRNALPAPVITDGQNYITPRDAIEEKLVEIWSEVLGIEKNVIGIDSNFFDLGGHSLKATLVVSKIHMMLNVKVPLPVMFRDSSIRKLGGYIKTLGKSKYAPIDRVEEKEYYDISNAQKRLWIIEQMKENQTAYNIPITFQLEGPLNIRAFELAFLTQVERHESLRTVFITIGGEPKQKIIASGNTGFKLDYVDFRGRTNAIKSAREFVRQELKMGFDLEKGPLVRAKLLHIEEEKYVFQLILHHIIADGWSMNVLFSELINIYINNKAAGEHTGSQPEPLRIQYKDYTAWQNKQVTGAGVNPHREYWLRQFSGKIPVIKLTTDKRRPAVKNFNGKAVDFIIDNQMKMALDAITQRTGASLFMILLALVNLLLRHYTGQEEFVIGSPVAGRRHDELKNQVGFYVNTLPFRIDMTGIDTFGALLQKIKQTSLDAYEYQEYPFDLLVEELGLRNDPGRNPLFDVMMVLQNNDYTPYPIPVFRDLKISSFETGHDTSTFELNFHFTQLNDYIYLNLIYDSDLFEEITIRVMGMKLLNLIKKIINIRDIGIKDITPDDLLPTTDNKKIDTWDLEF